MVQVLVQQISCGLCGSRMGNNSCMESNSCRGSNSCILGQHGGSHNHGTLVSHSHSHSKIHKVLMALVVQMLVALAQALQMLKAQALDLLIFCGHCGTCKGLSKESNSCILEQHSNHEDDTQQVSHNHGHSKKVSHNKALRALVQALLKLLALALGQLTSCGGGGCHSHM